MSAEVFKAKYGAELMEIAPQSRASEVCESRGPHKENQSANQKGTSEASTDKKISIMVNYMLDLSSYALDLSDYA